MNLPTKLHALTAALLLCAPLAQAQNAAPAATVPSFVPGGKIPRLSGPVTIDGKLDDAAWAGALEQELAFEIQPGDNIAAPAKTLARIAYDDDALYVAFRAQDPDPTSIRAHLRDRDNAFNDDWVGVFLDTFNDHRRGYEMVINPLGVQGDLIRDETNANNQEDPSWDGLWQSAGQLTDEGYVVEVRIPFATLRFPRGSTEQTWGISLIRNYPRDKRHQLTSHPVPRESNCFQCEWGKYQGMAGVQQGRNLEIVPTLMLGATQQRSSAQQPWKNDHSIAPGVDVSWAPSPAMTLNATLNPDFSQVETDQLQLNFNDSFALFYQEKRPFFLEGADYFTSPMNVLYTRQIADPDAGLRITGRSEHAVYGALVARDATTLLLVPGVLGSGFAQLDQSANVAVGRYRYDFSTQFSLGAIGTFRQGEDYANHMAGIDARWLQGGHTLTAQWLHSTSRYPGQIVADYRDDLGNDASPSGNALLLRYGFSDRHWNFNLQHNAIDPGFRADLGFIGQVGFEKSVAGAGYTWYRDGKAINQIKLYGDWDITHRYDRQLLERELEFSLVFQGPMQSNFGIAPLTRVRYWNGAMYREHNLNLFGNIRPSGNVQLGTYMNFGQMLDLSANRTGRRQMLGLFGNHNVGLGMALNWEINQQRLLRDGGRAVQATVLNAGGSWQFDPRQRLRLTLQGSEVLRDQALYTNTVNQRARKLAAQLVYSYKVNPRTALYAGASSGAFLDDDHQALFNNTRSLFLKLSYGWQP